MPTPLTYGLAENGDVLFTTWQNNDAVRNLGRDASASVLIEKVEEPHAGVHLTGSAEATPEPGDPEEYARHFSRYLGDWDSALESYSILTSPGLGDRAGIRSFPRGR